MIPAHRLQILAARRNWVRKEAGFTLIEVMVALVIVGLALPALITQVIGMVDGTASIRDQTLSHWVANNRYAQLQLQQRVTGQTLQGQQSGRETQVGREWSWQVLSEPTEVEGLRRLWINAGPESNPELIRQERFLSD